MTANKLSKIAWTDEEARRALGSYEAMVCAMARRLRPLASAGRALDEEDLRCEGRVAVLEALKAYGGYGIAEATWVRTRVRQRMIDAIRRLDPRSRDEMRLVVKHAAGKTAGAERRRGEALSRRRLVSMDFGASSDEPMTARLPDEHGLPADEALERRERSARLLSAIDGLPQRQRLALQLGLFEGLALKEIGARMGISESRVCQLQKRAVQRLHGCIAEAA